jgi:L-fuculose-phosphate aldolase
MKRFALLLLLAFIGVVAAATQCATGDSSCAALTALMDTDNILQMSAKEVVTKLEDAVKEHSMLHHDFLKCFQEGGFADMKDAVRTFAANHYTYSKNFIKYLQAVAEKVRPDLKHLLLENINEEEGNYEESDLQILEKHGINREWANKKPHRDLIKRFLLAADVDQTMFNRTDHPGGRFTQWILNKYDEANACEALSMIGFAVEETVSTIYQYLWDGLKLTDMDPQDIVFFPLHILIDDGHADLLKRGFAGYWEDTPELCKSAPRLVLEVLDRRSAMMDELREIVEYDQGVACNRPYTESRVTQLGAIRRAAELTKGMPQPTWNLREKMALGGRILASQGHGKTLSGQITCRGDDGTMWTQRYGTMLEGITPEDFIKINAELDVVSGDGFPNLATRFHLHVYEKRPDLNCAIHTHSPYISALALTGVPLHIGHMDNMALYDDVAFLKDWPGVPFGNEEGEIISNALGSKNAALLAHHGLFAGGKNIEEAIYRAWFMEQAAEMQLRAMSASQTLPQTTPSIAKRAARWRITEGPVKAHFNAWAKLEIAQGNAPFASA